MREIFTYGSVGGAPGNRCFYPEPVEPVILMVLGGFAAENRGADFVEYLVPSLRARTRYSTRHHAQHNQAALARTALGAGQHRDSAYTENLNKQRKIEMKKRLMMISFALILCISQVNVNACTSLVIKTDDGSPIYGRTMEWGAFDLHTELMLVPRKLTFTSELGGGKKGMTWKNKYGFVAMNAVKMPFVTDGMNETGLTLGVLYFPGFAKYQNIKDGEESRTLNNVDLSAYILGQFKTVQDIKETLPKLRVVYNKDIAKVFGAPAPLHLVVTDNGGASIVIEYVGGKLHIYDNTVGVMTNSPSYDWHILNLRNYPQLKAFGGNVDKNINGVSLAPFGAGSGMLGLPGDVTPVSRFIRAVAFTSTMIPPKTIEEGVNEVSRILNNFDIPRGLVREGVSPEDYHLNFTQWSTIGDIKNKHYYWWTEFNRRMRVVDLKKLNFTGNKIRSIPLDEVRKDDIKDRTNALIAR